MLTPIVLLLAAAHLSQDVAILPRWKQGDKIRLDFAKTKEDSRRPEGNGTSHTPVELEILSADAKGFRVRWRNGATRFPEGAAVPPILQQLMEKSIAIYTDLQLSPEGEFQAIVNEEEVSRQVTELMHEIVQSMKPDAQFQEIMKRVMTPELILQAATADAKTYFSPFGVAMKPKEKVKVDTKLDFPLAPGQTLAATYEMEFVSLQGDLAEFHSVTRFDEAALRQATLDFFAKVSNQAVDAAKVPHLQVKDTGIYRYQRASGTLREVIVERITELGPSRRLDRRVLQVQ